MRIQTTTAFKQQLDSDAHSLDIFCAELQSWTLWLIYILPEPDAHRIAQMQTTEDRETMLGFAAVAEAFIQTGKIIV